MSGLWGWMRSRHPGRWTTDRWLVLASGLAAATPIIVATVRAVADRWYPLGDDASLAVRAYDVLTTHSPLLGPASQVSGLVGRPLYSPGPLVYWPAALPAHWGGPTAMIVVLGLVNIACVMGVIALARRRGGVALMFAAAILVPLMLASLPAVAYRDVWAQAAALLPFTLLIFVAWSIAVGEYRLLPLAVLLASFVAQAHLAYLAPSAGLLVVALGGLILSRRAGAGSPPSEGGRGIQATRSAASPRGWILAAVIVALVCWAPPLLEQAQHRPGNLVLIGRAATKKKATLGGDTGWHAVVRAFGVPPWWLRGFQTPEERIRDLGFTPTRSAPAPPSLPALSIVSALLVLGAVVVTLVVAARRRTYEMVAAMAISLVLVAALFALVSSTPSREPAWFISLGYTTWWAAAAGMWVWLTLGWSVAVLFGLGPRLRALARPERISAATARPLTVGLGLAAIVAVGVLAAAGAGQDPLRSAYRPLRSMAARVEARVPRGHPVLVESGPSFTTFDVESAVVYALRHRGVAVVSPDLAIQLGHAYDPRPGTYGYVVRVDEGRKSPPPGGQVISRLALGNAQNKSLLIGRLSAAQGTISVLGAPARSTPNRQR